VSLSAPGRQPHNLFECGARAWEIAARQRCHASFVEYLRLLSGRFSCGRGRLMPCVLRSKAQGNGQTKDQHEKSH
jgi:hypothetical protein